MGYFYGDERPGRKRGNDLFRRHHFQCAVKLNKIKIREYLTLDFFYAFYQQPMTLLAVEEGPILLAYTSAHIDSICGPCREGEMLNDLWRYSALISLCRFLHTGILCSWGLEKANDVLTELANSPLTYQRDTVLWETYEFCLTTKGKSLLDNSGVTELGGPAEPKLEKALARAFRVTSIKHDQVSVSREALDIWIEKLRYEEDAYPFHVP